LFLLKFLLPAPSLAPSPYPPLPTANAFTIFEEASAGWWGRADLRFALKLQENKNN